MPAAGSGGRSGAPAAGGGGRGGAPSQGGLNLVELEILLNRFGVGLDQFANALGVTRAELARANVSLGDLERMGITLQQLQQVGITIDDLRRIGVDVSSAGG